MSLFTLFLAAGSLVTLVAGIPIPSSPSPRDVDSLADSTVASTPLTTKRMADSYSTFTGTGAMSAGWPSKSAWVPSFDDMFNNNKVIMTQSCAQWGQPNDSTDEINDIYNGIKTVSSETGIDARFILAVLMQESNGCVRVPTTNWGVRNPGLMQDHNGAATCNEGGAQNPCPANTITQMIRDGVAGTSSGDGLEQCIAKSGASDDSMYYKAARMYNSGSIDSSGDLGRGVATHCYASDIANRLTGWVSAAHTCCLDSGCASDTPYTPPSTAASTPAAGSSSSDSSSASSGATVSAQSAPSGPTPPGALGEGQCSGWYTVQSGDYCGILEQKFGISMAQLQQWNPGLDGGCSNLWLGYSYCVSGP